MGTSLPAGLRLANSMGVCRGGGKVPSSRPHSTNSLCRARRPRDARCAQPVCDTAHASWQQHVPAAACRGGPPPLAGQACQLTCHAMPHLYARLQHHDTSSLSFLSTCPRRPVPADEGLCPCRPAHGHPPAGGRTHGIVRCVAGKCLHATAKWVSDESRVAWGSMLGRAARLPLWHPGTVQLCRTSPPCIVTSTDRIV